MPSIFPDTSIGGVVVRNAAGVCLNPPGVSNAYCPPASFISTCEITALPTDCTARISPDQINAISSELLAFAQCLDPSGPWDCGSVQNLCAAFNTWWAINNVGGVIISETAPIAPGVGQLWWESDTGKTHIWYNDGNTSQWVQIAPGSGGAGPAGDFITQDVADLRYVNVTGDIMSGPLYLPSTPPVAANEAVTKQYVDSVAGGLPTGGDPGEALVINAASVPEWGAPIDAGTY